MIFAAIGTENSGRKTTLAFLKEILEELGYKKDLEFVVCDNQKFFTESPVIFLRVTNKHFPIAEKDHWILNDFKSNVYPIRNDEENLKLLYFQLKNIFLNEIVKNKFWKQYIQQFEEPKQKEEQYAN